MDLDLDLDLDVDADLDHHLLVTGIFCRTPSTPFLRAHLVPGTQGLVHVYVQVYVQAKSRSKSKFTLMEYRDV